MLTSMSAAAEFQYDVAIIGGGSAGYAAARVASGAALSTVVIDGANELGGLCILRGCMPTKALLHAAEVAHQVREARKFGIQTQPPVIHYHEVVARRNGLIDDFASYRRKQLTSGNFNLIRAHARFLDEHTLALSNGELLRSRNFVVCTGSKVAPPPLSQLAEAGYVDSDGALKLSRLPESLIVLGGGAVALEYAQFFARMGVQVKVVQRSPHVLHEMDADAASVIESVFTREGLRVYKGTQLLDARKDTGRKHVTFIHEGLKASLAAEEIFFGLGRIPATAELDLPKAGVMMDTRRIVTNSRMQTSVPHIYAAGDCTSPYEIVHLAVIQGEIAGHNIARPEAPREMDYRLVSEVVFTDPQIATVGLTEKRAQARSIPYLAASYAFADHGKSMILDATDGFVKLLADPKTGEIIGGCCVGPFGGELIHEIIAAMHKRMTVQELAAMPHYHPTLAEIWTYPAEELAEKIAASSPLHRVTAKS